MVVPVMKDLGLGDDVRAGDLGEVGEDLCCCFLSTLYVRKAGPKL